MNRIADRFGRAAATYDKVSAIQREVASELAGRIHKAGAGRNARVAEFGCGTGHLTKSAWATRPSLWVATDIAPAMIGQARRADSLSLPNTAFAVMDAARPALKPGFDVVCSSLVLQWLDNPAEAISRWRSLVRPGGMLAVSTLAEGTFREWRDALSKAGAPPAGPRFPSAGEVCSWFGQGAWIDTCRRISRYGDALEFLRDAKAGGFDAGQGRSLDAGVMRRAMRTFNADGGWVTYEVLYAVETV